MWQVEMMHYPKQQQCCIDILSHMEQHGVIPDDEMGNLLTKIFSKRAHAFRKYQRMMYWMPKFKYANPYYVPQVGLSQIYKCKSKIYATDLLSLTLLIEPICSKKVLQK